QATSRSATPSSSVMNDPEPGRCPLYMKKRLRGLAGFVYWTSNGSQTAGFPTSIVEVGISRLGVLFAAEGSGIVAKDLICLPAPGLLRIHWAQVSVCEKLLDSSMRYRKYSVPGELAANQLAQLFVWFHMSVCVPFLQLHELYVPTE